MPVGGITPTDPLNEPPLMLPLIAAGRASLNDEPEIAVTALPGCVLTVVFPIAISASVVLLLLNPLATRLPLMMSMVVPVWMFAESAPAVERITLLLLLPSSATVYAIAPVALDE